MPVDNRRNKWFIAIKFVFLLIWLQPFGSIIHDLCCHSDVVKPELRKLEKLVKKTTKKNDLGDKQLDAIGQFLGSVTSQNAVLADKSICKVVVECLVILATLDSGSHLQAKAWAKSRLRHMLWDESNSETSLAVKFCGFDETLCNDMTSQMIASYLGDRLSNCESDDEFRQLILSLDIGRLMFIPQASSVTKAVLRHNSTPTDTKHQIARAYSNQGGKTLDSVLASIWLEDLEVFETAVVDLVEALLLRPDIPCTECTQLIGESQITKACAAHPVLKAATMLVLDCFKEQSKGCPLVASAITEITHSIREMENSVQPISKITPR